MWVFCCGMFRSASTLQFQITSQLVQESGRGIQVGWIDAKRFAEVRSHYTDDGYKVIKVHLCPEAIQAEFAAGNALGIYIHRDIRDVYASMMKQRQKSFDFLWNEGFLDTCLESYQTWTQLPNVLISEYAQVMADLPREVDRIAQHLKIDITPDRTCSIAAAHSIAAQKERITQFRQQLLQTPLNPSDHREIVDYHDEATLLHMNHIDSAKIDRWKDDLTAEQVDRIEAKVREWGIGYRASTLN
ncbi:sulfotransferase domain-containing protein [Microcoleus sp. FACHB-1515]|uniref:sulfotransferase domain-containing protein n=1 Tax=Cyanophyceae TaxID=3028117 RepID=UPI0016855CAF|nr:sulfotransferase domain-containing protein [Microcoleus sp. FACHB-1515]MBD2091547.1 sulfotransferase domain-containing protein [Microcoleus sp. FACHB-1515]